MKRKQSEDANLFYSSLLSLSIVQCPLCLQKLSTPRQSFRFVKVFTIIVDKSFYNGIHTKRFSNIIFMLLELSRR